MKKFKLTPEQKAYIKSLDCECKKKDAKKRFRIQNELKFYEYNLAKEIFRYSTKDLKNILIDFRERYNQKINQIEVKAEEVVKEEKKYVWIHSKSKIENEILYVCSEENYNKKTSRMIFPYIKRFEIK